MVGLGPVGESDVAVFLREVRKDENSSRFCLYSLVLRSSLPVPRRGNSHESS